MTYIIAYIATAVVFFIIDIVWLGVVAKTFYRDQLGDLMAPTINWRAGALFYAMYIVGIVIFAIAPALAAESVLTALIYGALFGFFCYGTYDMTNMATLRNWPTRMSIVDMAWGTCLTAASAAAGYAITQFFS